MQFVRIDLSPLFFNDKGDIKRVKGPEISFLYPTIITLTLNIWSAYKRRWHDKNGSEQVDNGEGKRWLVYLRHKKRVCVSWNALPQTKNGMYETEWVVLDTYDSI